VNEVDFMEHFFYECNVVKPLWNYVENKIAACIGKRVHINKEYALFGVGKHMFKKEDFVFVNHLILIAKMSISIAKKSKLHTPPYLVFEQALRVRVH
jgi:hypothetical protein